MVEWLFQEETLTSTSCRTSGLEAGQEARDPQPGIKIRDKESQPYQQGPYEEKNTVNASTLSSVVGVQVSQAGWGVDVQVNRLGELEKGDVVRGGQWIVVVLMDNRVNFQCYIFPDASMRIQSESTCLCRRHC